MSTFNYTEIWAAVTNDRSTAVMVGITRDGTFQHQGLGNAAVRYYWARTMSVFGELSTWYPVSATAGVMGMSLNDPTEVLKLLNRDVTSEAAAAYLAGTVPMISLLDTDNLLVDALIGDPAFLPGVVLPGVQIETLKDVNGLVQQVSMTRIYADTANANILLQAGRIDTATGLITAAQIAIDGANAAIELRATKGELQGQVDVLSDLIGAKLSVDGTVKAGMAITYDGATDKSNVTFMSDTFLISKPDGTGSKPIFGVGTVNGVATVGITGDLIVDGGILARHIGVGELVVGTNVTMGAGATITWANLSAESQVNLKGATGATGGQGIQGVQGATGAAGSDASVPSYITSTKITQTTIESPTITAGTITGSQFVLGNGATYGKLETYDFANKAAGIQILDGATPTINVKGGTVTGSTLQTADPAMGTRRFVVSATNNRAEFWGDQGDATICKLAAIGIDAYAGLQTPAIATFGAYTSIVDAVACISGSGVGIYGITRTGYGAYLGQDRPSGIYRQGIDGFAGQSPCRIAPGNGAGAPTHNADVGSLWVDKNGVLYIQTTWRNGNGWQKVGAQ